MLKTLLKWSGLGLGVLFAVIQLVPYGRAHTNPPVRQEPAWDSAQTRHMTARACFDCHSNETTWPWYSNIAPVSWLIQRDVDEGRRALNYSAWDRPQGEARESAEKVTSGEMPPWYYALPATSAYLTPPERAALIRGLRSTFGSERTRSGHQQDTDRDD